LRADVVKSEGEARELRGQDTNCRKAGSHTPPYGDRGVGGLSGANSAESAVDLMEASLFRSFAAVNGALRAPPPAAEGH
jgi:hypothetical protein